MKENFTPKGAAAPQGTAQSSFVIYSNNEPKRDCKKQLETLQASFTKYFVEHNWY